MSDKVIIEIFKDGTIHAETEGVKGKKCKDYVKILEDILEAKAIDTEYKPEYYQEENQEQVEETVTNRL